MGFAEPIYDTKGLEKALRHVRSAEIDAVYHFRGIVASDLGHQTAAELLVDLDALTATELSPHKIQFFELQLFHHPLRQTPNHINIKNGRKKTRNCLQDGMSLPETHKSILFPI